MVKNWSTKRIINESFYAIHSTHNSKSEARKEGKRIKERTGKGFRVVPSKNERPLAFKSAQKGRFAVYLRSKKKKNR